MAGNQLHIHDPNYLTIACLHTGPVFYLKDGTLLKFQPGLPKKWNGQVLPGSENYYYSGELGDVLIQEYRGNGWIMRYTIFEFTRKTSLQWKEEAMFRIQFALQGKIHYQYDKGKVKLKAGTVNTIWAPGRTTEALFAKRVRYQIFHILYEPNMVQQLLPQFPTNQVPSEKVITPIESEWLSIVHQILQAPYETSTRLFYYENRVRDILLALLLRSGSGIRYEGLTSDEVTKIHEVDALILGDITHWLHIPVLAKKVHLSEFKLKMGFKQVIGVNLFERLRLARLEKAKRLLVDTDLQIKVIYTEVGYRSLSAFEEAFKEKYGLTPFKYRHRFKT